MIIHTLLYRFPDSVSTELREQFFAEMRKTALETGLVTAFGSGEHHQLAVDSGAHGMTATAVVQFACKDVAALRRFSELPHVHELIARWRTRTGYQAAYANHDDLLGLSTTP